MHEIAYIFINISLYQLSLFRNYITYYQIHLRHIIAVQILFLCTTCKKSNVENCSHQSYAHSLKQLHRSFDKNILHKNIFKFSTFCLND